MTHLALQIIFANNEVFESYGLWLFLSVGAVAALFGIFLLLTTWMEHLRKEREAFYRAETIRRIAEAPGEGARPRSSSCASRSALRVSGRAKA